MDDIKKLQLQLVNSGFLSNRKDKNGNYVEVDGIYGDRTSAAYQNYLLAQQQSSNYTSPTTNTSMLGFKNIKKHEDEINKKSNEEIIQYYHNITGNKTPYIIDDKKNNRLKVYVNGQLVRDYPALHGINSNSFGQTYEKRKKKYDNYTIKSGDTLSKIAKQFKMSVNDLQAMNGFEHYYKDKNGKSVYAPGLRTSDIIYPGQQLKVPIWYRETTEIDPDEMTITYGNDSGKLDNLAGNLTTPAGIYYLHRNEGLYHGAPSFMRRTKAQMDENSKGGIPSSIHAGEIYGLRGSNGCIRLRPEDAIDLGNLLEGYDNVPSYGLPANEKNKFKIRNGELQFSSHDISKTPAHNTFNYTPIKQITISQSTWNNLDDHQRKVFTDFSKSLISNKEKLQKALKINNDTYNQLAQYALATLDIESSFGKKNNPITNVFKLGRKYVSGLFGKDSSSSDVYFEEEGRQLINNLGSFVKDNFGEDMMNTLHLTTDKDNSSGLTQMRYLYLSDEEKDLFDQFNISREDLTNDPTKAAIATMIKLGHSFTNQGMNFDNVIKAWNNGPKRVQLVKNRAEQFNILQDYTTLKQFDGGKLIYRKNTYL